MEAMYWIAAIGWAFAVVNFRCAQHWRQQAVDAASAVQQLSEQISQLQAQLAGIINN